VAFLPLLCLDFTPFHLFLQDVSASADKLKHIKQKTKKDSRSLAEAQRAGKRKGIDCRAIARNDTYFDLDFLGLFDIILISR